MTVLEAIKKLERRRAPQSPMVFSSYLTEVSGPKRGKRKRWSSGWRHNLTTDTATGYTNRRDWQAKAMGGGPTAVATMTGNATATTATSLTNSGASFPTAGQGLAGMIVAAGPNSSGTGSTVFGVIVSNTGTALTVDMWYSAGTIALGTTPNATCSYQILPGQMPAMFQALSSNAGAPSSADTTLASEFSTNGYQRKVATFAHTAAATTYSLQSIFNVTGTATVNEEALFSSLVINLGAMPFESAEPNPPTLVSGDQLTQTVTVTIN